MTDKEQLETLKAFILCEAEDIVAYSWLHDTNQLRILWRMWFNLYDILPELREFAEEAIHTLEQTGKHDYIPQGWYWKANQERLKKCRQGIVRQ